MARLGDVATYVNGFAFKPEDWSSEGLPIIRIQDLTGNSYQANRYDGRCDAKYEVNPGDILISWSASLGVYVWQNEKALLNQHIFKVIFNKVEVDKSFFVHQVRNILDNAGTQAHGATMKHLTKPVFDALPFYLPDLPTQRRIAATLDKVSEGIALCKQMLVDLDTSGRSFHPYRRASCCTSFGSAPYRRSYRYFRLILPEIVRYFFSFSSSFS